MVKGGTTGKSKAADRVALYARISEDGTGLGAGVTRQLVDTRELAKSRGWTVVAELVDNNISAMSGKQRPQYAELMRLVEAREIDRVVVFHMSRLWRAKVERAVGQQAFAQAGVSITTVSGPEFDFSTATGRMLAGVVSEIDAYESELKRERVARASEQRAAEGKANGATHYGYRKVKGAGPGVLEPSPKEAAEIRRIIARVVEGWSLRRICLTCSFTVISTIPRLLATALFDRPRAIRTRPSCSRVVSGERAGRSGSAPSADAAPSRISGGT